jgi:putative ABC transport system ATP-binding protein
MIQALGLTKSFRNGETETIALKNISLDINRGEFVAVLGPSDSGKSTLLNMLGLLTQPSGGTYIFMGEDVSLLRESEQTDIRRGKIGFVFQDFNLIDDLNIFENVELPLIYLKIPSEERRQKVRAALDKMDITHRLKHFPQQLSAVQQQRVAIARAMVAEPDLILADEPTGNLNNTSGDEVMKILIGMNREHTTILMGTHTVRCAQQAGRVIHLLDGQIVSADFEEKIY